MRPLSAPFAPWRHRRLPAASLGLALLLAAAGLAGCQNREKEAERLRQEQALQAAATAEKTQLDALVQRCEAGQEALVQAADALAATETALANLERLRYRATARPQAPDPATLQRFTISDQELELERHQQALEAWQKAEQTRRARWQAEQRQERQRLQARLRQQRQALSEANPAVLAPEPGAELDSAALAAYRSCQRETLASLKRS
ncbi:rootletin, putative [Cyanobium sp. PCC 7001]|uniref:hypothetical protein n=1 Tax=Cyanobium sp. PCC 7001 TaxID=180281 RepID=UPI00018052D2|nr:hypothetical protein [Cyanobium sp. PCC 7001]EDY38656.1 rootletin, putative [Cyanobium sp. PCC 7001]